MSTPGSTLSLAELFSKQNSSGLLENNKVSSIGRKRPISACKIAAANWSSRLQLMVSFHAITGRTGTIAQNTINKEKLMRVIFGLLLIMSSASATQYVDHKNMGLQERVLMRGSDYVELCSQATDAVNAGLSPTIDGCMLYTEGLRTGYGKATTEVVMQAALFNASPAGDDWEAALGSPFYDKLKAKMTRCDLSESTPVMAKKLSAYVKSKGKEADVMASIYFNFLKDQYSRCK